LLHYLENAIAYNSSQKLLNKSAMDAVFFSVVTKQEILVIYLTDFFDAASRRQMTLSSNMQMIYYITGWST